MLRRLIAYFIDWYLAFVVMNTMLVAAAYLLTGTMYAGSLPLTAFEPGAQLPLLVMLAGFEVLFTLSFRDSCGRGKRWASG